MARRRTKRVALCSPYLNVLHFHIVGQPFLLFQNIYLGLHIIGFESRIRVDVPHELQALQGHYTLLLLSLTSYLKRFSPRCRGEGTSPDRDRPSPPEGSSNLIQIASIHVGKLKKPALHRMLGTSLPLSRKRTCHSPLARYLLQAEILCALPYVWLATVDPSETLCCALGTSSKWGPSIMTKHA